MTKSMTSYGRSSDTINGKSITAEIKSVNSRFLDCTVKVSRAYSFLEEKINSYIRSSGISRGKVEVYVSMERIEKVGVSVYVDKTYAEGYIAALKELRDTFLLPDDLSVMTVAQNKELFVVTKPEENAERDWADLKPSLDKALESFFDMRASEGENLRNDLQTKRDRLILLAGDAELLSKKCADEYEEKFKKKLLDILGENSIELDENRILTEVAIYASKIAIDEELVRLKSHFKAFDEIFDSEDSQGRKLDFLIQEMNREVNTIGSKANDPLLARIVIEMKSELEKLREQVQNIE